MGFDWREFVALAKDWQHQPGSGYTLEAVQRSAVSRAYYGAFCCIRDWAKHEMGFMPTAKAEDHISLREHLKKRGKANMASDLNRLRQWRNKCDYNDTVSNLNVMLTEAINAADNLIQSCT